jgi:hypothetical protein
MDKYEDVSIYFFKNENLSQPQHQSSQSTSAYLSPSSLSSGAATSTTSSPSSSTNNLQASVLSSSNVSSLASLMPPLLLANSENLNHKLKLWKCCTLIKQPNLTFEKILNRIKNERYKRKNESSFSSRLYLKTLKYFCKYFI